jgi:hypothetical protein
MTDRSDYAPYQGQHCPAYTPIERGCTAIFITGVAAGQEVFVGNQRESGRWMVTFLNDKAKYFSVAEYRIMNIDGHKEERKFDDQR